MITGPLPVYKVRAVNIAPDSENKIHDDQVAAQYGFRGGLVVGVTVYGYMAEPVVAFAPEWLEHGAMQFRLFEPFYDGEEAIVKAEVQDDGVIQVSAEREAGQLCAKGTAVLNASPAKQPQIIPEAPLPARDQRPLPSRESIIPDMPLGTVYTTLESTEPAKILQLSNEMLVQNFRLGPWIHAASEVRNWSRANSGDRISVRGRIQDRFDRKGHEFLTAYIMLIANGGQLLQTVRHTAIYRIRTSAAQCR
jgi:hypothetical protein